MTRISAFRFTNVIKILSVLSATLMCFIAPTSAYISYTISYNKDTEKYTFSNDDTTYAYYSLDAERGKACFGWFQLYLTNMIDFADQGDAGFHACINGCKANYYYVTITSNNRYTIFGSYWNSSITGITEYNSCAKCPEHATCEQTDGHKKSFTCNDGYFESNYKCNACPPGAKSCTSENDYTCPNNSYNNGNGCTQCPENASSCTSATNFTCNTGYYKDELLCTKCPENASSCTSATNFTCNTGYYKDELQCKSCPDKATCNTGTDFTCEAGYYKNGSQCTECPTRDDVFTDEAKTTKAQYTSNTGATSIDDCYLPTNETYYNKRGKFQFTNQCKWEQKN